MREATVMEPVLAPVVPLPAMRDDVLGPSDGLPEAFREALAERERFRSALSRDTILAPVGAVREPLAEGRLEEVLRAELEQLARALAEAMRSRGLMGTVRADVAVDRLSFSAKMEMRANRSAQHRGHESDVALVGQALADVSKPLDTLRTRLEEDGARVYATAGVRASSCDQHNESAELTLTISGHL